MNLWWLRFNRGPRSRTGREPWRWSLSSCFGGATALTSGVGWEGATGWGCGADRGVELGVESSAAVVLPLGAALEWADSLVSSAGPGWAPLLGSASRSA